MNRVRQITAEDKTLLAITLLNAGIKARLRVIRNGIRAVVVGEFDRELVAAYLNQEGFRFAGGQKFSRYAFDGNQIFVRGVVS